MDADTHEIKACALTDNTFHDSEILPALISDEKDCTTVSGDGAYDVKSNYSAIKERGALAIIPPRKTSKIEVHANRKAAKYSRDENIRGIRKHGRKKWQELSGYHRRSLVETAMYRIKTIF